MALGKRKLTHSLAYTPRSVTAIGTALGGFASSCAEVGTGHGQAGGVGVGVTSSIAADNQEIVLSSPWATGPGVTWNSYLPSLAPSYLL